MNCTSSVLNVTFLSCLCLLGCSGIGTGTRAQHPSAQSIDALVAQSDIVCSTDLRDLKIIDSSFRVSNWSAPGKGLSQYKVIWVSIPPGVAVPPRGYVILFMVRTGKGVDLVTWVLDTQETRNEVQSAITRATEKEGRASERTYSTGGCLTANCHARFLKIKRAHAPVRERQCGACHLQVASNHPGTNGAEFTLPAGSLSDLCLRCHESLRKEFQVATVFHKPVEDGKCGVCHDPHGTDLPMLFQNVAWKSEWEWPYGPPQLEVTKLCWQCHDRKMIFEDEATAVTGFRHGNRNLHYFHVNYRKGRTCKACHETHAGRHEKLFRESVPFGTGGWKLPISVTLTEDGGSCIVGCHRPQSYSRVAGTETDQ